MKKILLPIVLLCMLIGCGREFEPKLTGLKAYTHPARRLILEMNGQVQTVTLPGHDSITYRYAQWTKSREQILLAQRSKTKDCYNYQVVAVNTTGEIVDTVYAAPPTTAVNFKLAPNDSLLILKTYFDNCEQESSAFKYTFYNRYTKKSLQDTIEINNAEGIAMKETIWSPDSRKVIISEWFGHRVKAYAYNLATKDTTHIDIGENFTWSPIDSNVVAYIKDYSIYTKDLKTGETQVIFKGKKKKRVGDFRWSPKGDYMMIQVRGYLLNVEANMLGSSTITYLSLPDKKESKVHYTDVWYDTWKSED